MRAESVDLLNEAEQLKNRTDSDLRENLDKSIETTEGLEKKNKDVVQKIAETTFNLNYLTKSMQRNNIRSIGLKLRLLIK